MNILDLIINYWDWYLLTSIGFYSYLFCEETKPNAHKGEHVFNLVLAFVWPVIMIHFCFRVLREKAQ